MTSPKPSRLKENHLAGEKPPIFKLSTTNTAIIALFISILLFTIFLFSPPPKSTYHSLYISSASNATIPHHLLSLTRRPHVAGSPANDAAAAAAAHVISTLSSFGIRTRTVSYDVSLPYTVSRSLSLTLPPHPPATFSLRQEPYAGGPHADVAGQAIPTFHAYARPGSAAGHVAYVNYGRVEDFERLMEMGVDVSGAVVLARYGKVFRGDIVRNAHNAGAVGVVLYTDSKDYGGAGAGGGSRTRSGCRQVGFSWEPFTRVPATRPRPGGPVLDHVRGCLMKKWGPLSGPHSSRPCPRHRPTARQSCGR